MSLSFGRRLNKIERVWFQLEGDKFDYSSLNRCFNKLAPFAYDGCMRIYHHVKGEDISFLRNIMDVLNYARACHGCNTNSPTYAVDGPIHKHTCKK